MHISLFKHFELVVITFILEAEKTTFNLPLTGGFGVTDD